MPVITEEEANRRMAEILREQMARPTLRPSRREELNDYPQNATSPVPIEDHGRNSDD